MTEAYEDDWLVRVRAQVMCRDEGTGGWLPLGGGGLSNVMVRKRPRHSVGLDPLLAPSAEASPPLVPPGAPSAALPPAGLLGRELRPPTNTRQQRPDVPLAYLKQIGGSGGQLDVLESLGSQRLHKSSGLNFEYFIFGKRISDQSVVLSCTIKRDFQYNKVMPTFHHWVTDEKRFGLTFQTAADARAFDRGVRTAIEDLLDGLGGVWPSLHTYKQRNPAPKDDEDDNIFECLNLPSDSRSSSENSTASRSHRKPVSSEPLAVCHLDTKQPAIYNTQHSIASAKELLLKKKLVGGCSEVPSMLPTDPLNADNYSYVQLSQVTEYIFPSLGTDRSPSGQSTVLGSNTTSHSLLQRRDSGSSIKKRGILYGAENYQPSLPIPNKKRDKLNKKPIGLADGPHMRIKCRHCQELYTESSNKPGSCEYAPDCFKSCINETSCIRGAQCMLYHCMSDAEGDFAMHPCACNTEDDGCNKRWIGLTLLSLLIPCLWCYPPLRAVHWCCVGCGVSGGKHNPVQTHPAYMHH